MTDRRLYARVAVGGLDAPRPRPAEEGDSCPMFDTIQSAVDDPIVTTTLNRPDRLEQRPPRFGRIRPPTGPTTVSL
ncbi:MAG: hypothetical protein VX427_08960 [Acidobacteriota bacterium]|nr:hypothetical protein [Acidobacteriota bacterium]